MKLVFRIVCLMFLAKLPATYALPTDLGPGDWALASARACSTDAPYEDPFFAFYVTKFQWRFLEGDLLEESISMHDPDTNFDCDAVLHYQVSFLPREPQGELGYMDKMHLKQISQKSSCLHPGVRPQVLDIHYLLFPTFLETYESNPSSGGPCPGGNFIVTQFKRIR